MPNDLPDWQGPSANAQQLLGQVAQVGAGTTTLPFAVPPGTNALLVFFPAMAGYGGTFSVIGAQSGFVYFAQAAPTQNTYVLSLLVSAIDTQLTCKVTCAGGQSLTMDVVAIMDPVVVAAALNSLWDVSDRVGRHLGIVDSLAGASALAKPINAEGVPALPVVQAYRKATYTGRFATNTGALAAGTDLALVSWEHAANALRTVRFKLVRVTSAIVGAPVAAGMVNFRLSVLGSAASSAGAALGTSSNVRGAPAAELTVNSLPTIAFSGGKYSAGSWAPLAAGPLSSWSTQDLYRWVPGETEELVLRAGFLETLTLLVNAVSTPNLFVAVDFELTEE